MGENGNDNKSSASECKSKWIPATFPAEDEEGEDLEEGEVLEPGVPVVLRGELEGEVDCSPLGEGLLRETRDLEAD